MFVRSASSDIFSVGFCVVLRDFWTRESVNKGHDSSSLTIENRSAAVTGHKHKVYFDGIQRSRSWIRLWINPLFYRRGYNPSGNAIDNSRETEVHRSGRVLSSSAGIPLFLYPSPPTCRCTRRLRMVGGFREFE